MAKLHTSFVGPPLPVSKLDQDLDRCITVCADGDFDQLLRETGDWATFYNLTELRTGLLAWYDIPANSEVMEIGADYGALTGILCERAGRVAAVEPSMFRARAISRRYSGFDNLDIYAGDLPDLHITKKFNLIIAVDILPRIAGGTSSPEPYIRYLELLRSYLTFDGKLLLAMDNRFGLKYFCGARDPYTAEPFGELSGAGGGGHLFSREEISFIAKEAGFPYLKFYYPLPDYRIPTVVYSDNMLPDSALLDSFFPYDCTSDSRVLQEKDLYMEVIDNGAFPFMANSFLVECSREDNLCSVDKAFVSAERGRRDSVATGVMSREGLVVKRPVFAEGQPAFKKQVDILEELRGRGLDVIPSKYEDGVLQMPFFGGVLKLSEWFRQALPKDKERVISVFDRLWAAILQSSPPVSDRDNVLLKRFGSGFDWGVILKQAYVGMVPANILYMDSRLVFFNQEFVKKNYPAKYPMFRAIYYSYSDLEAVVSPEELKERYGLGGLWPVFMEEEKSFVASIRHYDVYHQLYSWAEMDSVRMFKNRQILKIIGNE